MQNVNKGRNMKGEAIESVKEKSKWQRESKNNFKKLERKYF